MANPNIDGTRVTMHLRITLADGTVAEDTFGDDPLVFHIGDGSIVAGLDTVISSLAQDEQTTVMLAAEDAFGAHDEANIHMIPRSSFGPGVGVAPGLVIGFTTPAGDELAGSVVSANDDEVEVDFNHPLAGHNLSIDVHILNLEAPEES